MDVVKCLLVVFCVHLVSEGEESRQSREERAELHRLVWPLLLLE